jgi:hypothetical protein
VRVRVLVCDVRAHNSRRPRTSRYCDLILRKGPKHISDEVEMERALDDVVALFKCEACDDDVTVTRSVCRLRRYLPDKDVFGLVYAKLLSKRLIQDNSGNDDFEAAMINKLKMSQVCARVCLCDVRMCDDAAMPPRVLSSQQSFSGWCK